MLRRDAFAHAIVVWCNPLDTRFAVTDAGIYIPTLAEQILWGRDRQDTDLWSKPWLNEPEPLQGILVGNGCNGEETWSCGEPPAEVIVVSAY